MSEYCQFEASGQQWLCRRCGRIVKKRKSEPPLANCKNDQAVGIGDVIHKITELFGVERCLQCLVRQFRANRWFPFPIRDKQVKRVKSRLKVCQGCGRFDGHVCAYEQHPHEFLHVLPLEEAQCPEGQW